MYIMYVDETGMKGKYTILSGVIIHEKNYNILCNRVENLLINTLGTNKINLKDLRRKYHCESKFLVSQYLSFENGYYSLLSEVRPVFLVSAVNNSWTDSKNIILEKAYEHLLERFQLFLKNKGGDEYGLIIYDKSDAYFKIIKEKHKNLISNGSSWGWKFYLIHDILEKDDNECRALQIADMLSSSMNSYLNNIQKDDKHYTKCKPFFDIGPNGQIEGYGIKIF